MSSQSLPGSLRAINKNKKRKNVTRNVLTLPENYYWPEVPKEKVEEIVVILKDLLSPLKRAKVNVSWHLLKKVPKEKRKDIIKQEVDSLDSDEKKKMAIAEQIRKEVTLGVNSTLRCSQRSNLSFCLIEAEPKILVDKVLTHLRHAKVLAAVIPNLKAITKDIFDFSANMIGFKNTIKEESSPIRRSIKIQEILKSLNLMPPVTETKTEIKNLTEPKKPVQERLSDVYLFRDSKLTRIFRPGSKEEKISEFIEVQQMEDKRKRVPFKRYCDDDSAKNPNEMSQKSEQKSKIFEPPLVVTLQSNQNKKKKR